MLKKIMAIILSLTVFCLAENPAAFSFLSGGAGARALSMGGAFTAVADDASALYWNPAGLANIDIYRTHLMGMFTNMDHDRLMGFAGISERMENGAGSAGLCLYYFRTGKIDGRDDSGALTGEFEYNTGVLSVSYANSLTDSIKAGLSIKYYYASVREATGRGLGADVGFLIRPFGPYFSAGLAVKDINSGVQWSSGRLDYVKTTVSLGAAQNIIYERFLLSFEAESGVNLVFKYRTGGEYILNKNFAFRFGLNQGDLSAGFGAAYSNYRFDYAFLLDQDGFADIHRFSFSAGF